MLVLAQAGAVAAARQAAQEAAAVMEQELQHKLDQLQQQTQEVGTPLEIHASFFGDAMLVSCVTKPVQPAKGVAQTSQLQRQVLVRVQAGS